MYYIRDGVQMTEKEYRKWKLTSIRKVNSAFGELRDASEHLPEEVKKKLDESYQAFVDMAEELVKAW